MTLVPLAMPRFTLAVLLVAGAACGGRAIQTSADDGPNRVDATVQAPQLDGAASTEDGSGCVTPECAPPGPYVAFMCACGPGAPASSGLPSSYAYAVAGCTNPTCVRVPFEYPSPGVVVGTVGGE